MWGSVLGLASFIFRRDRAVEIGTGKLLSAHGPRQRHCRLLKHLAFGGAAGGLSGVQEESTVQDAGKRGSGGARTVVVAWKGCRVKGP